MDKLISTDIGSVTTTVDGKEVWTKGVYGRNADVVKDFAKALMSALELNTFEGVINEVSAKQESRGWASVNMPGWKSFGTLDAKYSLVMECFRQHGLAKKVETLH